MAITKDNDACFNEIMSTIKELLSDSSFFKDIDAVPILFKLSFVRWDKTKKQADYVEIGQAINDKLQAQQVDFLFFKHMLDNYVMGVSFSDVDLPELTIMLAQIVSYYGLRMDLLIANFERFANDGKFNSVKGEERAARRLIDELKAGLPDLATQQTDVSKIEAAEGGASGITKEPAHADSNEAGKASTFYDNLNYRFISANYTLNDNAVDMSDFILSK